VAAHAWAAGQDRRRPGTGLESRNLELEAGSEGMMDRIKGGRMARVSSLMGYWAAWANYCAEKWAFNLFRVVRVIRVPGIYTRITRNKFGFLEVLPEIRIGYFGFG